MLAVKLIIRGRYWDSQIDAERLYLFTCDGDLLILHWKNLIRDWRQLDAHHPATMWAFLDSRALYSPPSQIAISTAVGKRDVIEGLTQLAKLDLEVSKQQLDEHTAGVQESPFPFPHADALIHDQVMYGAGAGGVFAARCNEESGRVVIGPPTKKWDGPTLNVSAASPTLAAAAGSEGAFALPLGAEPEGASPRARKRDRKVVRLYEGHCSAVEWAYESLYCSSHLENGGMAVCSSADGEKDHNYRRKRPRRVSDRFIPAQRIFDASGYSWARRDKLCLAEKGRVHVVKYVPSAKRTSGRLIPLGQIAMGTREGLVSACVAMFGMIIETHTKLTVLQSNDERLVLPGEPVNWRVFPRSICYENQLHVVYDDRLEIWSFNHDCFVDQDEKRAGCTVSFH